MITRKLDPRPRQGRDSRPSRRKSNASEAYVETLNASSTRLPDPEIHAIEVLQSLPETARRRVLSYTYRRTCDEAEVR